MRKHILPAACAFFLLLPHHAFAQLAPRDAVAVPQTLNNTDTTEEGLRGWARGVIGSAHQGTRDGINGYSSNSAGFAMGMDTALKACPAAIVGFGLAYTSTDIDAKNANTTHTDVNSYQFSLYGDYDLGNDSFLRGSASYTRDDNSSARHNVGLGATARGDYDADQLGGSARFGRYFHVGPTTLTPSAGINAMHYSPDSYNEHGAGPGDLHTAQADINVFELGAGLDAGWVFDSDDNSGGGFSPALHFGYSYDTAADKIETFTSPVGGGLVATTFGPSVARSRFDLGADILWFTAKGWDVKAGYNADIKSDYVAQSGTARFTVKF